MSHRPVSSSLTDSNTLTSFLSYLVGQSKCPAFLVKSLLATVNAVMVSIFFLCIQGQKSAHCFRLSLDPSLTTLFSAEVGEYISSLFESFFKFLPGISSLIAFIPALQCGCEEA